MMDTGNRQTIAVVVPVLNEEANVDKLCERLKNVIESQNQYNWQLVFVDDGSRDATVQKLNAHLIEGLPITILKLSRNFGHQAAMKAGLDFIDVDAAITLDGDGQHPPEFIPELLKLWQAGHHVVHTVRSADGRQLMSLRPKMIRCAYKIINWFSDQSIPSDCADFRLMDKAVLTELKKLPEINPTLRGLVPWLGFKQIAIDYQVETRMNGKSRYPFRQTLNILLGGIFDLSTKPLVLAITAAVILVLLSIAGWAFDFLSPIAIWVLIMTVIELIGLSLVSIYLGRAYTQVLDRPMYIVSEKVNFDEN